MVVPFIQWIHAYPLQLDCAAEAAFSPFRGSLVIELELPEPEFEDLTLLSDVTYRGGDRGHPGTAGEGEPLRGWVKMSGPDGRQVTPDWIVAHFPEAGALVDPDTVRFGYYHVHLAVRFAAPRPPKLRSARVLLTLGSIPDTPPPSVLYMEPLRDGDPISIERKVVLGPRVKVLDAVEAEAGHFEQATSFQRTDLYVVGDGRDGCTPQWRFTQTAGRQLVGDCLLQLIVRAARGANLSVSGEVTAKARRLNVLWPYKAELPRPLTFSDAI